MLIIEPDDSVRDALCTLLSGKGWRVLCHSGIEALRELEAEQELLAVISESHLLNGQPEEVLSLSAERGAAVIFTGHDISTQRAVDLVRQGAIDYLDKPFEQRRLLDLLKDLQGVQNR